MPTPRVITTLTELVKYVKNILGSQWDIASGESTRVEIGRTFGIQKHHYWHLSVECSEPVKIRVFLSESTFPQLVKTVDRDLWERIREEFEKASVQWQRPGQSDAIEKQQRRITRKQPALPNKQLALPGTVQASPAKPKQLLLPAPPPGPNERRCNWPGCCEVIDVRAWACRRHWQLVPHFHQERISRLYTPGLPSEEYLKATDELREFIKRYPNLIKG